MKYYFLKEAVIDSEPQVGDDDVTSTPVAATRAVAQAGSGQLATHKADERTQMEMSESEENDDRLTMKLDSFTQHEPSSEAPESPPVKNIAEAAKRFAMPLRNLRIDLRLLCFVNCWTRKEDLSF